MFVWSIGTSFRWLDLLLRTSTHKFISQVIYEHDWTFFNCQQNASRTFGHGGVLVFDSSRHFESLQEKAKLFICEGPRTSSFLSVKTPVKYSWHPEDLQISVLLKTKLPTCTHLRKLPSTTIHISSILFRFIEKLLKTFRAKEKQALPPLPNANNDANFVCR